MTHLVLIRADASQRMGSGHVMRCLTLADALRVRGRTVEFVCRTQVGNFADIVQRRGFVVHVLEGSEDNQQHGWLGVSVARDAQETLHALAGRRAEWLIVDHYGISAEWEAQLAPHADKLMTIDDMADRDHICHLLLDQNFSRQASQRYAEHVSPACTQLLGPGYALLRDEFARGRAKMRPRDGQVRRVLVFFGGSDPDNLTGKIVSAMAEPEFDGLALDVVLGAANPHQESIAEQLSGRLHARLMVQVDNMADLMAAADLAIGAGGGTTWERMCMGLPTVVVTIAENQVPAIRDLHALGLLRWAGDINHMDQSSLRAQIVAAVADPEGNRWQSAQGMQLVDGHGAAHVADLLCGLGAAKAWKLRRAKARDRDLYWRWINDPLVRASAIHTAQIPWETHCRWFANTLACPNKWLFVAEGAMGPVGQVRFERSGDDITIDYSVAAQFRGQGQATILLEQAIEQLQALVDQDACLHASVRTQNRASARVFQRLGFTELAMDNAELRIFRRRLGGE